MCAFTPVNANGTAKILRIVADLTVCDSRTRRCHEAMPVVHLGDEVLPASSYSFPPGVNSGYDTQFPDFLSALRPGGAPCFED